MQTCPASSYWPAALRAAASRSCVGEHDERLFPPSSAVKGTMLRAAAAPICRAASGDPVNETRRTRGSETSAAPTSSPMPWTMLNTPGGNPASSTRSASTEAVTGDHSAGLRTTVLPGGQGRGALPRREHERRVPRGNDHRGSGRHALDGVRRAVGAPGPSLVLAGQVRVGAEIPGAPGDHAKLQALWSIAMSRHSSRAIEVTLASMRSASRCMQAARSEMPAADQSGNASTAAVTACSAVPRVAAGEVAELERPVERGAIGERADGRNPPPADVVVGRDGYALDVDSCGSHRSSPTALTPQPDRHLRGAG